MYSVNSGRGGAHGVRVGGDGRRIGVEDAVLVLAVEVEHLVAGELQGDRIERTAGRGVARPGRCGQTTASQGQSRDGPFFDARA